MMWILGAALTTIHIQCFLFTRQTSKTSENLMVVWNKNLVFSSSGHSWSLWIWQNIVVLLFPVGHQFVFWLSVLTVSIKSLPTYCLYFCFPFTFFFALNSTTSKFIMRVTHPTSPHPLPICCCALERRGNRHWSLLPSHMHAHTLPSTSLSIDRFNVFLRGRAVISFSVILHLFSTACWHYDKSQSKNVRKREKVEHNTANYSSRLRVFSQCRVGICLCAFVYHWTNTWFKE